MRSAACQVGIAVRNKPTTLKNPPDQTSELRARVAASPSGHQARIDLAVGFAMRDGAPSAVVTSRSKGASAGLGRLLSIVAESMRAGTWERLKACESDECRWAFYDNARNRSGRWCDMAVCGNRMKARAYRARNA